MEKNNDDVEFALVMFKTQLQDTLTLIGKAILKDLTETLTRVDDIQKLNIIKEMMSNPFSDVSRMCSTLSLEYLKFKHSPEVQNKLESMVKKINDNPNLLDDLLNATPEDVEAILKSLKDTDENDGNLQ